MVQRKVVRKKPKDSVGEVDHVRGGGGAGDPGSRGGGGGGGGVVRAAVLPNYMRATSSSGARAGREAAGTTAAPPRKREAVGAKVAFAGAPYVSRATCSSAMRGLGLGLPGGGEAHVCPYSYCSFKCHAPVVPLRSLVASRRRLIKTQQSMKLKGASPFRKAGNGGGGADGLFVEIYSGATAAAPAASSDCSDLSTEDMAAAVREGEYAGFDHRSRGDGDEDKAKDSDGSVDGSCGSSDVISGGSVDLFVTKSRGCKQEIDGEKWIYMDQEAEDFGACKSDISEELDAKYEDGGGDASHESSVDDISSAFGGMNFKDVCSDHTGAASSQRKRWNIARGRTSEQGKQMRPFNPRAPNFLPVEPDPEAEKVDLRHQMMGDRKNAEEWMVDYALRRTVHKLARAQKRKVEMLVQAFETVLPPVGNDKKSVQHVDKTSFTLAKSLQTSS
ncbi:calmodulin binding protein PICBP [Oryza brachyantha]|uniref:calmodulin binding protein PICBP n=1 Tax=Oryza brachyantha TaxID=4533 RepID=UPI001ADBD0CB|nr:calmodulin binding protein PICBP [Oryza brachyantha]